MSNSYNRRVQTLSSALCRPYPDIDIALGVLWEVARDAFERHKNSEELEDKRFAGAYYKTSLELASVKERCSKRFVRILEQSHPWKK